MILAMGLVIAATGLGWPAVAAETNATAQSRAVLPPPLKTREPRLVRTIEFKDYGSAYLRLGDLDADGLPEVLVTQAKAPGGEDKAIITCLTALDLEGRILWQVGEPNVTNTYFGGDLPVQIYDLDHDGSNEVIYIPDEHNVLTILEGKTGKVKKQVPLAGGHDSLLFADFQGRGYAQDLLVKDRYHSFWVYGPDFNLLWAKTNVNPGHYPMNFDVNGDGRDELLCGYTLYDGTGKELWHHPDREFGHHDDAVYIADMNDDGRPEIAIATSGDAVLLDADGNIIFRKKMGHCQHALIGKFRTDLPGNQVCYLDRYGGGYSANRAERRSTVSLFTMSGEQLWQVKGSIWVAGIMEVDNWTGNPNENFICHYSRGFGPPVLLDGYGREVAIFPFPAAITQRGAGPDGKDVYEDYFVQHIDCYGDEREEILVFNSKELRIYTNPALWQKPRLFNGNYYPGRL
jgi:hypothetical protein